MSGDATLQFGSGAITAIDTGASLELDGAGAQILTDGGANSALSGLAANDGTLRLSGKTLTTTSSFVNSNVVSLDTRSFDGGADLTFGGALTNTGWFAVGNQSLSAPTTVRATALVNTGSLIVQGNYQAGTAGHASVILSGAAPSTLTRYVSVSVGGDATLQFGSGAITAIGAGASLEAKYGAQILTDGGASSALSGLATNAGTLVLSGSPDSGGMTLTTTSSFVNSGVVSLDTGSYDGGVDLTFGGALTNTGGFGVGNSYLSAPTTVRATALVNTAF